MSDIADDVGREPSRGEKVAARLERCNRSNTGANAAAFIWLFPDWKPEDPVPDYTGSFDAAYSLMSLLPVEFPWNLCTTSFYGTAYVAPNEPNSFGVSDPRKGEARNPTNLPSAISAAIIRALAHFTKATAEHRRMLRDGTRSALSRARGEAE